ncbi:hypothetical protein SDC9_150247 [bioreactor metagenome]|uniref:Uncharacterized protein n=1 Tax=bioreactor metagenome TaxID=1076179 RepID=A0A645EQZ8_9ZZZZ
MVQRTQRVNALARWNDRVMVSNLLIIDISGLFKALVASQSHDILKKRYSWPILHKPVQILMDLLCHCR